jgi:hypothetical protein
MQRFTLFAFSRALALGSLVLPSAPLFADEAAQLTVAAADPPAEVADPIRTALDGKVLRLSSSDATFFEFWFRKELPLANQPAGGTLELGTIQEGTVVGVVKVDAQRYDFRNEEIPRGVYIIRLGIQPEDGNHLGVAPTRTFALLIPADRDTKLAPVAHNDLMKAAASINAAKHPSNLNLQPVESIGGEFPRLDERNDGQHKVLLLQLPASFGDSSDKTTLTFALVYEGTGQI